jgi:cytochrome c
MAIVSALRRRRRGLALLLLASLAGCGDAPAPATAPTASASPAPASPPRVSEQSLADGFDVGEIKPAREYLAEPRFAAADLERGELLSLACQACHTLRQGQRHNVGPNLFGIFGRRAAAAPDFPFSDALERTEIVWTPKALEAWLVAPAQFVVGNNMTFAGFSSATDRRDLIAFLLRVTSVEPSVE